MIERHNEFFQPVSVWDETTGVPVPARGVNGAPLVGEILYATKITTSGGYTYIAEAVPHNGAYASRALHEAAAVWRCQRIDANGSVEFADANTNFDNVATDLTALTYS